MNYLIQVLALSILVCVFGLASTAKADNASDFDESIKQALSGYEKAWNKKDAKGVIAFYHDNADIMTGGDRKIVSKKEYEQMLPDRWKYGAIKFSAPKIDVKGDKAKVKVKAAFRRLDVNYIFYMVRHDNIWLITVQEY